MIVWIDMLELDNEQAALETTCLVRSPDVHHFHDPERLAGKAIAQMFGGEGKVAWDIYLIYNTGDQWINEPPEPAHWMHQLYKSGWADRQHYHAGGDLVQELHNAVKRLLA